MNLLYIQKRGVFKLPVYCNYNHITPPIEYARTLMARDYKGFGTSNETSNAVLEINNTSIINILQVCNKEQL